MFVNKCITALCVTSCRLINAEVSKEGPEYNFEVEGWQKIESVKKKD